MEKRESDLNYCEADKYRPKHKWKVVGVDGKYVYYYCSKCEKYAAIEIRFVKGGEPQWQ